MGNRRKPNATHKLHGTGHSTRHNRNEEPKSSAALQMPAWVVHKYALESWHGLVPLLEECSLLAATDSDTVGRYCNAVKDYRIAEEEMAEEGMTVTGAGGGLRNHPAWARKKDAEGQMHKLSIVLGLSPSDRASLGDLGLGKAAEDEWSDEVQEGAA